MKRYIICLMGVFTVAVACLFGMLQYAKDGPVVVVCNDCVEVPITLDKKSEARFRKHYYGAGKIVTSSRSIPYARFQVGGATLWWSGNTIEQVDVPFHGVNAAWDFPVGATVIERSKGRSSEELTKLLVDALGEAE